MSASNGQTHADHNTIQLFADVKNGMVEPDVPVRWCICRSLLERIKAERELGRTPLLVMVVIHEGEEVDRKVLNLTQELEYFMFHRPGEHVIKAVIVFSSNVKNTSDGVFRKSRGGDGYFNDLINDDGNFSDRHIFGISAVSDYEGAGEIGVHVDKSFFPVRPPEWLWKWVNYFFETARKLFSVRRQPIAPPRPTVVNHQIFQRNTVAIFFYPIRLLHNFLFGNIRTERCPRVPAKNPTFFYNIVFH